MSEILQKITPWLAGLSPFLILIIGILLYKPENLKKWASLLWYPIGSMLKFARKGAVKNELEYKFNKSLKNVNSDITEHKFSDLSIKWVNKDNADTILEAGSIIVPLDFKKDKNSNLINLTSTYVKRSVLAKTKPYISRNLKEAIDFTFTKKLLQKFDGFDYLTEYLSENPIEDQDTLNSCSDLQDIDDSGLFTRIMIRELKYFGSALSGRLPKIEHQDEASKFQLFLHSIATRDADENTELIFEMPNIKTAIILVSKIETYTNYGIKPYLSRIRSSIYKGVNRIYLLARNQEKINVLNEIHKELLLTSAFTKIGEPKLFKDSRNRKAACYALVIDEDSYLNQSVHQVKESIQKNKELPAIIKLVNQDSIKVDLKGIEGWISKDQLGSVEIENAKDYFEVDQELSVIPYEFLDNGVVRVSNLNTETDIKDIVTKQFKINDEIEGTISYIEDTFAKVTFEDSNLEGIVFRDSLTKSKYIFLHKKISIGDSYKFIIKEHDFQKGRVVLSRNIEDPWHNLDYKVSQKIEFKILKKFTHGYLGELEEGVEAILYHQDLGWIDSERNKLKSELKLNDTIRTRIKRIDAQRQQIVLSAKKKNPIEEFLADNEGEKIKFKMKSQSEYGITGNLKNGIPVFIPKSKMNWSGGKEYKYHFGKYYDVVIVGLNDRNDGLIGSFKEIVANPLNKDYNKIKVGSVINCSVTNCKENVIHLTIKGVSSNIRGVIFKNGISNKFFISELTNQFKNGQELKVKVKEINQEKQSIIMSLKEQLRTDIEDVTNYNSSYNGVVIDRLTNGDYSILNLDIMSEGVLQSDLKFEKGNYIKIRLLSRANSVYTNE